MTKYELAILGSPTEQQLSALREAIELLTKNFELDVQKNVEILSAGQLGSIDNGRNIVAVYFGSENCTNYSEISQLLKQNVIVIPIFESKSEFLNQVPEELRKVMGVDLETEKFQTEIAASMLECLGLLNQKRRIFISYVHCDNRSRLIALQLHKLMTKMKFEVFVDLHRLHYGYTIEDFLSQNVIESDVLVALDSKHYQSRYMTRHEFKLAKYRRLSILHLVLPKCEFEDSPSPNDLQIFPRTGLTMHLDKTDFEEQCLENSKINEILYEIQQLRCKSIVSQHKFLSGKIKAEIVENCWDFIGKDVCFSVKYSLQNGENRYMFPIIGMPSLETIADIANNAIKSGQTEKPVLKYDPNGFTVEWKDRLHWLNGQMNQLEITALK